MMLKDARDYYAYYSSETSRIARQLGFAGIGLIWLFKNATNGKQTIPPELIKPACLIAVGLALDLLHYIAGTVAWGVYNRCKERSGIKEGIEFLAPRQINWFGNTFFWLKVSAMIAAYYYLLQFLSNRVL